MFKGQKKYFITGFIFIFLAMMAITLAPIALRRIFHIYLSNQTYSMIELSLLIIGSIFYVFSPKYHRKQLYSIVLAFLYYIIFARIYEIFF